MSRPLHGAVLIGGQSRRMGQPKHLLIRPGDTRTFAQVVADALFPHVEELVISGAGELPPPLVQVPRVHDVDGMRGPLAGLLALARHRPDVAWVVAACDMPSVNADAVGWLVSQRRSDRIAVMPRTADGRSQPLFAIYEPGVAPLLEALARSPRPGPTRLADHPRVAGPVPPPAFTDCWTNVNAPADLAALPPSG